MYIKPNFSFSERKRLVAKITKLQQQKHKIYNASTIDHSLNRNFDTINISLEKVSDRHKNEKR